jgi:hypothetical protein
VIGAYHAACQGAAVGYMTRPGGVFVLRSFHPERCGPDLRRCGGGLPELAAAERLKFYAARCLSEADGTDERVRADQRARMRSAF